METRTITRLREGRIYAVTDELISEAHYTLLVNGCKSADFYCSPGQIEALAVGHAFTSGLLNRRSDLLELSVDEAAGTIAMAAARPLSPPDSTPVFPARFRAAAILNMVGRLNERSEAFRRTGACHSVLLANAEGELLFAEDVARHNALDKVIGEMLLRDLSPQGKLLVFSGRVALDMLRKVNRIRVKAVAAVGAPTGAAVEAARAAGVTVCGFVRPGGMNIYSAPEQVVV